MRRSIVTALRYISLAEATTFLVLLLATALKYSGPKNEIGVQIMGPIHGVLFLAYVVAGVLVGVRRHWRWTRTLVLLVAGVLPFAPFVVERTWLRQQELADASAAQRVATPSKASTAGPTSSTR